MSYKFTMKVFAKALTIAVVLGWCVPPVVAQEADEEIDEITVHGARSLGSMRAEIAQAEQVVYDVYNELNDDDGYDIICKKETRIGSQIPRRVCLARMYRESLSEATVDNDLGGVWLGSTLTSSKHQKILEGKMRDLAQQNPELLLALKERLILVRKFEAEKLKRYGK